MMPNLKQLSVAALLAMLGSHVLADSIGLYLVPGIFVDDAGSGQQSSKIDASFRPIVSADNMPQLVSMLRQAAQKHFGTLAVTIDSKNKLRTLVLSAQITRATRFQIAKPDGTTDVYLPITLSLYFSNPNTGEVLQSFSQTSYQIFTVGHQPDQATVESQILQQYQIGLQSLLDGTLALARKQFNPYLVTANVADTWHEYAVLSQGSQAGIGKGDVMEDADGNQIRVEHVGPQYAVALPVLGKARTGQSFSRPSLMKLSDVKKPRVLTLVSHGNADLPDAVATQLFADKLGSSASFANLPLNSNYSQVQVALDRQTAIGHQVSGQRSLPDYVIRLVLPQARQYELPTNLDYKTQRYYKGWAYAELLSLDGRVLYARDVSQQIEDTVSHGVGFADADRKEVVLKNTLNDLAERFAKEIRFSPQKINISASDGNQFILDDRTDALQPNQVIRVYRAIGKPSGGGEAALVPTWEARVVEKDGSKVTAQVTMPLTNTMPLPANGDVVLSETISGDSNGGDRIAYCPSSKAQLGSITVDKFDLLAYATAAQSSLNLINPQLAELLKGKVGGQSGFRKDLNITIKAPSQCIEALNRIELKDEPCSNGACQSRYTVRAAYRVKNNGEQFKQKILEHNFVSSGYPETTQADARSVMQQSQLDSDLRALLAEVLEQMK